MMRALLTCAAIAGLPVWAAGASVRSARVSIVFSAGACDVTSRFVIDTADPLLVEHRLMLVGAGDVPAFAVVGGLARQADTVGRTARLPVSLTGLGRNEYTVRYRVTAPAGALDRCPLLVPSMPTDGLTRDVRIDVEVPPGSTRVPGEFPAFTWDERRGTVAVGHLPSFVRVPYAPRGAPLAWRDTLDMRRIVDAIALIAISVSTAAWVALRKRRA